MTLPIAFETQRLRARPWRDADLDAFAAINADPEVMRHFPKRLTRAESDAMAARIRAHIDAFGWGLWAIETRADGEFIGFVGLHPVKPPVPCAPAVEVGWRLAAAHWGRGYASEAARAALEFAFTRLALPEVVSFTALSNTRSRAVMERIGLRAAGTFEHPAIPEGHPIRAHCLYRIAREDWLAAR